MATFKDNVANTIDVYKEQLWNFAKQVKNSLKNGSGDELIATLDMIFTHDKRLQDQLKLFEDQERHKIKMQRLNEQMKKAKEESIAFEEQVYSAILNLKKKRTEMEDKIKLVSQLSKLDMDSTLALAQRLSMTSSPPVDWHPEQPLILHRPPYPTEDLMRSSLLFRIMNIGQDTKDVDDASQEEDSNNKSSYTELVSRSSQPVKEADESSLFLDLDLNPDLL